MQNLSESEESSWFGLLASTEVSLLFVIFFRMPEAHYKSKWIFNVLNVGIGLGSL